LPFKHFQFPSDPERKKKWIKLINRQKSKNDRRPWSPTKNSVVCSEHFVCGKPTTDFPDPTLKLGYKPLVKSHRIRLPPNVNAADFADKPDSPSHKQTVYFIDNSNYSPVSAAEDFSITGTSSTGHDPIFTQSSDNQNEITPSESIDSAEDWMDVSKHSPAASTTKLPTFKELQKVKGRYIARTIALKAARKRLAPFLRPTHKRLLRNNDLCRFYTGIPTVCVFNALCTYIQQENKLHQIAQQCKIGRKNRKLTSKLIIQDAVLLTLMKLRLGLLNVDLAER
jgi:hypothetical protein